jgi:hypothetical protein
MPTASKTDKFRRRAEECERLAVTLSRTRARGDYLVMARNWRRLAQMAEECADDKPD